MPNDTRNPLARSFQVLRYLLRQPDDAIGVRKIASDLKMAPSSVHRLLGALVEEGLVERVDGTGTYAVGLEMLRLAQITVDRLPLHKLAIPFMRELVEAANETALLGLYDHIRHEMMFVAEVEANQPVRYINKMLAWLPVYAGASGLAIMAFLPEDERQAIISRTRLAAITDRTITERYKLDRQIETIRNDGYACSHGQRTPGAVAIGAPIFGRNAEVVGDVIITLPEQRFEQASEAYLASHVIKCADAITLHHGGRKPTLEERELTAVQ